jgi:two-component sensor histidine kinase
MELWGFQRIMCSDLPGQHVRRALLMKSRVPGGEACRVNKVQNAQSPGRDGKSFPFLLGGGQLGSLIRSFDWATTSLGPLAQWPQSLKTITQMLLLSPVPIVLLWGEDGVMIYNDAYSVFAGARHPGLLGSKVREGWPEVADFNDNVMKVGLAGGTLAYRDQELTLYRHGHPEQVWMNLDYSPVLDESGEPAGVVAIVVETSQRVLAERHLELVANELNHRVKNNLAMIQAIAAQTFRNSDTLAEAQGSLSARISALAQANDLLVGERWVGVSLSGAIEQAIHPHANAPQRYSLDGPELQLSPKTALSLSLAVHELATNATKYGAWSSAHGKVGVTWEKYVTKENSERLRIEWRERDGPQVTLPKKRGFGSRLIERGLAAEMGGEVKLFFEPEGLACVIDAPLSVYTE